MNSHKEWSDARVGKSSQNVEIKITLNIKECGDNFKCLYLRCYCDLSEQMKVPESSFVLLSMCAIRYGIGMLLTTSIFRFLKIGNFQDYLENPLKM